MHTRYFWITMGPVPRALRLILTGMLWVTMASTSSAIQMWTMTTNTWTEQCSPLKPADEGAAEWLQNLTLAYSHLDGMGPVNSLVHASKDRGDRTLPDLTTFGVREYARGLTSPDGLAIHPLTREIYVSEEDAARVSVIRRGIAHKVIDSSTLIYRVAEEGGQLSQGLRSPEGIAFDSKDRLYVAEDVPGGRLLVFSLVGGQTDPVGYEVPVPGTWSEFAWEDVKVGPQDSLVLVGSNFESGWGEGRSILKAGVILYRDPAGQWWTIHRQMLSSFSSVGFSMDGRWLIYTCEISGEVGWIDLQSREVSMSFSPVMAHGPEGACALPDGTILVTEERGTILAINPVTEQRAIVAADLGTIETIVWDPVDECAYVTGDGAGRIYKLIPRTPIITRERQIFDPSLCGPARTPIQIPRECPGFLKGVFARAGFDYRDGVRPELNFDELANRVPVVAADMRVVPKDGTARQKDPIRHLQFVVFYPNQMNGADMPVCGFVAVLNSGRRLSTQFHSVMTEMADPMLGMSFSHVQDMAVPAAAAVSVSDEGITSVQFLGLGKMADFHIVLNPDDPSGSYMFVDEGGGNEYHYRLEITKQRDREKNLVVSYWQDLRESWQDLGRDGITWDLVLAD